MAESVSKLAYARLKKAGWKKSWPFILEDLANPRVRAAIQADPSLSKAEKTRILEFAPGGPRYNKVFNEGSGVNLDWTGVDKSRKKSLAKYERGYERPPLVSARVHAVPGDYERRDAKRSGAKLRAEVKAARNKAKLERVERRKDKILRGEKGAKAALAEIDHPRLVSRLPDPRTFGGTDPKTNEIKLNLSHETLRTAGPARTKAENLGFGGAIEWAGQQADLYEETGGLQGVDQAGLSHWTHKAAMKSGVPLDAVKAALGEMGIQVPATGATGAITRKAELQAALKSLGITMPSLKPVEESPAAKHLSKQRSFVNITERLRAGMTPTEVDTKLHGWHQEYLRTAKVPGTAMTPASLIEGGKGLQTWPAFFQWQQNLEDYAQKAIKAGDTKMTMVIRDIQRDFVEGVTPEQQLQWYNAERVAQKKKPMAKLPPQIASKRAQEFQKIRDKVAADAAAMNPGVADDILEGAGGDLTTVPVEKRAALFDYLNTPERKSFRPTEKVTETLFAEDIPGTEYKARLPEAARQALALSEKNIRGELQPGVETALRVWKQLSVDSSGKRLPENVTRMLIETQADDVIQNVTRGEFASARDLLYVLDDAAKPTATRSGWLSRETTPTNIVRKTRKPAEQSLGTLTNQVNASQKKAETRKLVAIAQAARNRDGRSGLYGSRTAEAEADLQSKISRYRGGAWSSERPWEADEARAVAMNPEILEEMTVLRGDGEGQMARRVTARRNAHLQKAGIGHGISLKGAAGTMGLTVLASLIGSAIGGK